MGPPPPPSHTPSRLPRGPPGPVASTGHWVALSGSSMPRGSGQGRDTPIVFPGLCIRPLDPQLSESFRGSQACPAAWNHPGTHRVRVGAPHPLTQRPGVRCPLLPPGGRQQSPGVQAPPAPELFPSLSMVSHAWIDHRLSPQPHTMQPRLGPLIASPQEAPQEGEQEAGTGAGSSRGGQGPPETELCEEDRDAHSPTCRGVTRGMPSSMGLLHTPSPLLLTKQGHQMGCRRSQEWSSDSQPTMLWYKYISNVSWDILSLKTFHHSSEIKSIWAFGLEEFCLSLLVWGVCLFVSKSGSSLPTSAFPP